MNKHVIAGVAMCLLLSAQGRVWTNAEGKTLEAEIVRVKGDQVFLKIQRTRNIHPFEISDLSQEDQSFIAAHNKEIEERLKKQALNERSVRWHTDFAKAQAEAKELGFPILFLYTAPSWCGWCRVLEDNVLNQSEFKDYARGHLVYYMADFSDKKDGEDWKEENAGLYKKFPCGGFPCTYIVSSSGKKLGKIGGAEKEWGPQDFIKKIEKFTNK